eukprot:CAMPEP_0116004668 /NCGR_PEP_ID=MMETSP0321-20121206/730_1 /TAXON_ID=163516 /ORGANISM="Leptocylindrus danicus var. danicus, Strain B650" /LENGTH=604 /DNA_ID=CAMNT_0003472995 /DNA_START=116 /DNA_END=1930 /DNA_ORIENTATION=+
MSELRGLRRKARTAQKEATEAKQETAELKTEVIRLTEKCATAETTLAQYAKNEADSKKEHERMKQLLVTAGIERDDAQKQAREHLDEVARVSADHTNLVALYTELKAEHETNTSIWMAGLEEANHNLEKCQAEKDGLQSKAARDCKEAYERISALTSELLTSRDSGSKESDDARTLASNAANKISKLSKDVKEKEQTVNGLQREVQQLKWRLQHKDQEAGNLRQEVQRFRNAHANIRIQQAKEIENYRQVINRLNHKLANYQQWLHPNCLNFVGPLPQFQQHQTMQVRPQPMQTVTTNPSNRNQQHISQVPKLAQPNLELPQSGILKDRTNAVLNVLPPPGFGTFDDSSRNRKHASSAQSPSPQPAKRAKLISDESPPSIILQDQIRKILNSVSPSNVDAKARDLIKCLPSNYMEWFAGYFLRNFVLTQSNNHGVFKTFLQKTISSGVKFKLLQTLVEKISNDIVDDLLVLNEDVGKARCTSGTSSSQKMKTMGSWYAHFSRTSNILTEYCESLLMVGIRSGDYKLRVPFVAAVLSVVFDKRRKELTSFSKSISLFKTIHSLPSTKNTRLELMIEAAIRNIGRKIDDIPAAGVNVGQKLDCAKS